MPKVPRNIAILYAEPHCMPGTFPWNGGIMTALPMVGGTIPPGAIGCDIGTAPKGMPGGIPYTGDGAPCGMP